MRKQRLQINLNNKLYNEICDLAARKGISLSKAGNLILSDNMQKSFKYAPELDTDTILHFEADLHLLNEQIAGIMNQQRLLGINLNQLAKSCNALVQKGSCTNADIAAINKTIETSIEDAKEISNHYQEIFNQFYTEVYNYVSV